MTTRLSRLTSILLMVCGASWSQVTIVAASEYRPALEEIRKAFQAQTGIPTRVTYGSSGAMAHRAKTPGTDIFLSSDKGWADSLAGTSRADENPIVLGSQPVCVWVRGSVLEPSAKLEHLAELSKGEIVLADTLLSPDGVAAVKALRGLPSWNELRPRLVVLESDEMVVDSLSLHSTEVTEVAPREVAAAPTDSVAAVDSSASQAGDSDSVIQKKRLSSKGKRHGGKDSLAEPEGEKKASSRTKAKKQVVVVTKKVARSLSNGFLPQPLLWNSPQSGPLAGTGRWTPVDPELLPPLLPSVIRLKSLNTPRTDAAKSFLAFLQSPRGRSILRSNGFLPPP
jgi:ABC-type molybdate transport system substrate-binding protein